MAKGELEYDDLHDFFERPYEVSERADGSWLFTGTSDRYVGWTVELQGSELSGDGIFPDAGTIARVIIKTPGGEVADDVDDLSLLVTDLAADIDFGDHQPGDDDGGDGDDDLAGDDGDDDLSGGGGDDDLAGDDGDDDLSGGGGDDDLSGDDGDDDLSGGGGDDDLSGDDGNDDLSGGGGDDSLSGDEGDDDLHGQGGDDDLSGGGGDDHLAGSGGKDDLSGGDGNDLLKGQGKNDKLDGGADDDLLIGGGGKDVYIFALDFGSDTIKRFDRGKDKIDLSQTGLSFDDLTISRDDGDTIVTTSQGTITIDNVSGGKTVDQDDFLF